MSSGSPDEHAEVKRKVRGNYNLVENTDKLEWSTLIEY